MEVGRRGVSERFWGVQNGLLFDPDFETGVLNL